MGDFVSRLRTTPSSSISQTFEHLRIGGVWISIQASRTHYCHPRENLPPAAYTHWECALGLGGEWLSPENAPDVFDGLRCASQWEQGTCPVGGYIPTADVQELVDRLEELAATKEVRCG